MSNIATVHASDKKLVRELNISKFDAIVAGGAALRWFQNQAVEDHDIDIWFPSESERHRFKIPVSAHVEHESMYATTFRANKTKVQIIKKAYGNSDRITSIMNLISNFDITVCQIATDGNTWYYTEDFITDLKQRRLKMNGLHENSIRRLFKYWAYGFQPDDELLERIIHSEDTCWDYRKTLAEEYKSV